MKPRAWGRETEIVTLIPKSQSWGMREGARGNAIIKVQKLGHIKQKFPHRPRISKTTPNRARDWVTFINKKHTRTHSLPDCDPHALPGVVLPVQGLGETLKAQGECCDLGQTCQVPAQTSLYHRLVTSGKPPALP